jgi:hypothetical protein
MKISISWQNFAHYSYKCFPKRKIVSWNACLYRSRTILNLSNCWNNKSISHILAFWCIRNIILGTRVVWNCNVIMYTDAQKFGISDYKTVRICIWPDFFSQNILQCFQATNCDDMRFGIKITSDLLCFLCWKFSTAFMAQKYTYDMN